MDFYENNKLAIVFCAILLIVGGFWTYDKYEQNQDEKKATLVIDKVGMTVRAEFPYEKDDGYVVDLVNTRTNEIYFHINLSQRCPGFYENRDNTPIDVVRITSFNSKTEEKFEEFDGAYQKICWGKSIYKHEPLESN